MSPGKQALLQNDLKTSQEAEQHQNIIREAVNRILIAEPTLNILNSRKVVDAGNRV